MIITIYWKYPFDRNDEIEFAALPQKFDRSPEGWQDRIGDRLCYGFDWERIRAEKIDRNDDPPWWSDRKSTIPCKSHFWSKMASQKHNWWTTSCYRSDAQGSQNIFDT